MARKVECLYCGQKFTRTQYSEHLEMEHTDEYVKLVERIKSALQIGDDIKYIATNNNITEAFVKKIEKQLMTFIKEDTTSYSPKNSNIKLLWEPENFKLETTTVWSFPDRGNWATHSGKYRGNWSPFIPRNIILRYSGEGETVLDQFVGSGTTLIETKLLKRKGIGVDINPEAVKLTKSNTSFEKKDSGEVEVHVGDARNLEFIKDESIDLKWKIFVIIAVIILLSAITFIILLHLYNNRNEGREVAMQAKEYKLSKPIKRGNMSLEEAIAGRRSIRTYSEEKISEKDISQLLWAAQGITDEESGFRTAPSAGALYPLEIYAAVAMVDGIEPGLYKYNPLNHSLLLKKSGDIREEIYNASLWQDSIKDAAAVIIYCAVFKRTYYRYRNRAAQYVYIETGHSAQNVYLQAEALNLGTVAIGAFDNKGLKKVLELPDEEEPVYLMPVGKRE